MLEHVARAAADDSAAHPDPPEGGTRRSDRTGAGAVCPCRRRRAGTGRSGDPRSRRRRLPDQAQSNVRVTAFFHCA
ncbi:hypothetical protein GCM10023203_49840 [Actinomycetospora straminea]|uniref:Uncharacterized protein n=1 Tax=Actinomycetospora straminea TaxID=663607 RepID=A0ABP9F0X7_9PSEU